ncbi:nucleotidyltransferase family protein [Streptomyces antimicrobicus]|uniref:Nucleotidyltransferase family protein n=1 Tax=Streptomyces antimicrobicus TaxID=2883108 RepID=A0ABS8B593_9ACTN|nr:nucleotidyltransferase family protein [Streptomyces antimicrobicus]MCB5179779.1 nucleotidyltransferase family protein [Streptomyces antimicrobicus]
MTTRRTTHGSGSGHGDGNGSGNGRSERAPGGQAPPGTAVPVEPPEEAPLPKDHTQAILETTKQVAALLKRSGRPFALAGSVAAFAHGLPATFQHDTDFCVRPEDADAVIEALEAGGIRMRRAPEDWLVKGRSGGEEIDLIFQLARRPVSTELLDRATVKAVDSVWMPVLAPTDLMDSRLAALCEHYCDFGELLPMARMLREQIDWDRLERAHRDSPLADAFLHLLGRLRVIERAEDTGAPSWNGKEGSAASGMDRNGTDRSATDRNGTPQNGTAQNGTAQNGTAQNGTAQSGTDTNGTEYYGTDARSVTGSDRTEHRP